MSELETVIAAPGHEHPQTEAVLAAHGILPPPVTLIDPALLDTRSNVRSLNDETVVRYAEQLDDGATMPAGVANTRFGRLDLVAGGHRHAAHRQLGRPFPVYIIDVDELTAYRIALETNATHGLPLAGLERERHVLRLVHDFGLGAGDAARAVGLSRAFVSRILSAHRVRERLAGFGVKLPSSWSATTVGRLDHIESDAVLVAVATEFVTAKTRQQDVFNLVTRINGADSIDDQLAIINEQAEARTRGTSGPRLHTPRLRSAVADIMDTAPKALGFAAEHDADYLARQCRLAIVHLAQIAERIEGAHQVCGQCGTRFLDRVNLAKHRLAEHDEAGDE